jgi:hypothetical protein
MNEIIEDTISRNKKFQEQRNLRVKRLKELNAPSTIIEYEEMVAKMTLGEYNIHLAELKKETTAAESEYAKNNPIQKHIVDEIYNRADKLTYDYFIYSSNVHFLSAIDPLNFMNKQDFDNNLYQTFLDHVKEDYYKKYLHEFNEQDKDDD